MDRVRDRAAEGGRPVRPLAASVVVAAVVLAAFATACAAPGSPGQPSSPTATPAPPRPAPGSAPPSVPGPTTAPPPAFSSAVAAIPPDVRATMTGHSWRPGCPVGLDDLRLVTLTFWGFDAKAHTGRLVVHRDQADKVVGVFHLMYAVRFPIARMQLVDDFGADDAASMAANNTSAFNCRAVDGHPGTWSQHSYGWAIDVNPIQNPWVRGNQVDPPAGAPYVDRTQRRPGMIFPGEVAVSAFASVGWTWGGTFRTAQDYQHFSASGL